jgi:hypothetical protein
VGRLKGLFRQKEFHVLLFHVCLVLFGWPIVSFHTIERAQAMFVYLFLVWGVVIFLLFLVSRSVDVNDPSEESRKGKEDW